MSSHPRRLEAVIVPTDASMPPLSAVSEYLWHCDSYCIDCRLGGDLFTYLFN